WEERFSGVAYGFLFGGAVGVVGTLSDVSDSHAASLAEAFYERVLTPVPVGEALRGARERCRADPVSAGSPTWLSFVLYGNPGQVLLPRDHTEPAPAAASSPSAPTVAVPASREARRIPAWAGIVLALVLAAGFGYKALRRWLYAVRPTPPLVVGVMKVHARGGSVPDWMPEVTRRESE